MIWFDLFFDIYLYTKTTEKQEIERNKFALGVVVFQTLRQNLANILIHKPNFFNTNEIMNKTLPPSNGKDISTHFQPMFHYYDPWKDNKTFGFLMFLGGVEVED